MSRFARRRADTREAVPTASAPAGGFTLVEVLVGAGLAAAIMTAVMTSFVFLGRNLSRLSNTHSLETKAREASAYLSRDFSAAKSVKGGTTPTASTVTLVLPSGEVTYTYDSTTSTLRRQATFGANRDFRLLNSGYCACTSFTFSYFTASGGSPASQIGAGDLIPYSIKQVQFAFTLASPSQLSSVTRTAYETVSSRYVIRNKDLPDGS